MSETFELLGLLSLFHLFGGIGAGASLRRGICQGWSWGLLSRLTRGLVYGVLPLYFGATEFGRREAWHLVWVELLVFGGALLAAALIPDWIPELFNDEVFVPVLVGGGFMVVGVAAFATLLDEDVVEGYLALGVFGGIGGFVFVTGALKALKERVL